MRKRKPTKSEFDIWNEFQRPTDRRRNGIDIPSAYPHVGDPNPKPYRFNEVKVTEVRRGGRTYWRWPDGTERMVE